MWYPMIFVFLCLAYLVWSSLGPSDIVLIHAFLSRSEKDFAKTISMNVFPALTDRMGWVQGRVAETAEIHPIHERTRQRPGQEFNPPCLPLSPCVLSNSQVSGCFSSSVLGWGRFPVSKKRLLGYLTRSLGQWVLLVEAWPGVEPEGRDSPRVAGGLVLMNHLQP